MADFPDAVFSQRTIENVSGVTYDDTKTTKLFAEDITKLGDEITAIENVIGSDSIWESNTILDIFNIVFDYLATIGTTWLTGSGVPDDVLGDDGNLYLDTSNGNVYEKSSGEWGSPIAGFGGGGGSKWYNGSGVPDDGTGVDGDYYLDNSNGDVYNKAGGTWGSPVGNLTGSTGATGATGPTYFGNPEEIAADIQTLALSIYWLSNILIVDPGVLFTIGSGGRVAFIDG